MKIEAQKVLKGNNSQKELFFFYDPLEKRVVFSNQPAAIFFNADVKIAGQFMFPHDPDDDKMNHALAKWERSLLLMNGESQHWDMLLETHRGKECFDIIATGIEPVRGHLLVHYLVKRSNDDKLVDPFREKYNEFIDMAAHNLDAPVRKLSVLCDTVKVKMARGEDTEPYMPRVNRAISEIRSLVDSLTTLSRTSVNTIANTRFELGTVVLEVLEDLEQDINEKKAVVNVSQLPTVSGDRSQFYLLFRNLIGNAILYSRKEVPPRVDISFTPLSEEEKENWGLGSVNGYNKIRINDNGIGIHPDDTEKIFQPFVRLNGKSEFAGNGIGLAIGRKIVENHKGLLYADKKEDEGARFILIIPQTVH
jgi:signal transduction histidine kinase